MNDIDIIHSKKGNSYLILERCGFISLMSNSPTKELDNVGLNSCRNNDYNHRKIDFLKKTYHFDKEHNKTFTFLSEDDIDTALLNTHQLIFEVTDKCNLRCHYCGYGELYNNYSPRTGAKMDFSIFQSVYNFFKIKWEKQNNAGDSILRISFYGGEPLLNFKLIHDAVEYVCLHPISGKEIRFSMTTNALLINKYIKFLVEKDFNILVSIDGNERNNQYRHYKNGRSSFTRLINNLIAIKRRYPDFFQKRISFNSVLHDMNSVEECSTFLFNTFGKDPMTNELNPFGVAPEKKEEFEKMYRSKFDDYNNITDLNTKERLQNYSPRLMTFEKVLFTMKLLNYNVDFGRVLTENYLGNDKTVSYYPTNTCIPFSRRVFVTAKGLIYPCERIGNELSFGHVEKQDVLIDKKAIVHNYNTIFSKYVNLCRKCRFRKTCDVCAIADFEGFKKCMNKHKKESRIWSNIVSFFEEHPVSYNDFVKKVTMM